MNITIIDHSTPITTKDLGKVADAITANPRGKIFISSKLWGSYVTDIIKRRPTQEEKLDSFFDATCDNSNADENTTVGVMFGAETKLGAKEGTIEVRWTD